MSLRETGRIDIVARGPKGEVALVACDTERWDNKTERYDLLVSKIRHYLGYIYSARFAEEHPGKTPRDVQIVVTCTTPPTSEMARIRAVTARGETESIEVRFQHVPDPRWLEEAEREVARIGDERSRTLHGAAEAGRARDVERLLAQGADANAPDELGFLPFHLAVLNRHASVARLLLQHGTPVDARDGAGFTALHGAVLDGHRDIVEFLLANGADLNAADSGGFTPLHAAAEAGNPEVAELLLRRGANVNARTAAGVTPLAEAARRGHAAVVEVLRRYAATE